MYVSSEVRRREIPDATPDPSQYASSTGGASFLTILSEVGRTKDDIAEQDATRTRELAPESHGDTEEIEDKPAVTGEPASETNDSASGEAEMPETEATESASTESAAAAMPQTMPVTLALTTSPVLDADAASSAGEVAIAVSSAPTEGLLPEPPGLLADAKATPAEPTDTLETPPTESDVVEPIEGAVDAALPADVTMELDAEPAPALPVFPKTLNAILAEDALRPTAESAAPKTAPPASEPSSVLTEVASDASTELPESTPIPHATAMESGGVRPQTSAMPRLPLANLPGELAQQIHLMQQEGARTMRLRLVPENLGELQIEIQGTGDAMKVRLISGNPAVRDALESQMGELKDAMQKQGLALDQATVDGEPNRRGLPQEQERRPATTSYRETSTPPERPDAGTRRAAPMLPGSGALNVLA